MPSVQAPPRDSMLNAAVVGLLLLLGWWAGPPIGDFANYYTAACLWWEGADLAQLYDYRWFTSQAAAHGFGDRLVGFAVLTPPSALLAAPLIWLSPADAGVVWWVAQLAMVLGVAWSLATVLKRPMWWTGGGMLLLWPALQSHLVQGQFHLPAVLALSLGLWAFEKRHWSVGVCWGLAVGLKVHAWPLLVLLIVLRRWRSACAAGCTLLGGALGSVALLGWPLHAVWLNEIAPAAAGGWFTDPWHPGLQGLRSAARRVWMASPAGDQPWMSMPWLAEALPTGVGWFVVATSVLCLWQWPLLNLGQRRRLLAAVGVSALVCGPILVLYHLTLVIPLLVWAIDGCLRQKQRTLAGFTVLCVMGMVWTPIPNPPESTSFWHLFSLVPRFWFGLLLWGALIPWRQGYRWMVLGGALAAVAVSQVDSAGEVYDDAHVLQGGMQPLVASELVWSEHRDLCWSGLASERGGHSGRGWVGYCLVDGVPQIVASQPDAHVWAPTASGDPHWQSGPFAPQQHRMTPVGDLGWVEVRDMDGQTDLFWVSNTGAVQRLTYDPAQDTQPVWDSRRQRLWFLSDRQAGVRALRVWWLPAPWLVHPQPG